MKILSLRFQNLNSLEGTWFIDFTHPDYAAGGIFAITGPTGAGKTTILDAVCLALYGRTPRLGKITENFNEIMSRRQGECSAELVFESASGRFRATWSQHRARRKPGGKLQEPRHEIAEDQSGRVIEAARSRTEQEIVKISGMTFDQFTRSILLAQGEFAAFLKAEAEERAELLEQISGTEIYSRISMQVHARKNAEQEKLRGLDWELTQGPALAPDGEKALELEREAAKKEIASLDAALAEARQAAARLEKVAALEKKAAELAEKRLQMEKEWAAFQPDRDRLAADRAAAPLDGPHSRLRTLRLQIKAKTGELSLLEREKEAGAGEIKKALTLARREGEGLAEILRATSAEAALSSSLAAIGEKIQAAAGLRRRLGEKETSAQNSEKKLEAAGAEFRRLGLARSSLKKEAEEKERERLEARRSFEEFLGGRELSAWHGELRLLTQKIHDLDQAARLRNDLEAARQDQGLVAAGLERDSRELEILGQNIEAGKSLLQTLTERAESLETIRRLRLQVESLEERRAELSAGRPCPLCGSLEHPWADPAARPSFDETDQKLKEARAAVKDSANKLAGFKERGAALGQALKSAASASEKLRAAIAGLEAEIKGRGDVEAPGETRAGLALEIAALEKRLGAAAGLEARLKDLDKGRAVQAKALEDVSGLLSRAEVAFKGAELERARDAKEAAELAADLERALAEIRRAVAPYGLADFRPENLGLVFQRLEAKKSEREATEARAAALRQTMKDLERELEQEALKSRLAAAAQNLADLRAEALEAEEHFNSRLPEAGLADEAAYLAAALPPAERGRLAAAEKSLAEARAVGEAGIRENQAALDSEAARGEDRSPAQLHSLMSSLSENRDKLQAALGVAEQKIREHREAAGLYRATLERRERQKKEYDRWNRLHELIGSADGKKYRHFAQGLTFEVMVAQANLWLSRMSDRYLLMRDAREPLELCVIDNYQAGEIRGAKNLSGGERFIVSLALALGLSKMAGQNVRVDSLFLDEGFGTLDEDSLDTALEALSGLREHGKLIGVISHVPALTDRIPVQIKVTRLPGGLAALTAPGGVEGPGRPLRFSLGFFVGSAI